MTATREFLLSVLPSRGIQKFDKEGKKIPLVTLTFAQSLDGKIAGSKGRQLILSGADSMLMTHWYSCRSVNGTILSTHSQPQAESHARRNSCRHRHGSQ